MEKLLDMARKAADQAEVYAHDQVTDSVTFQDSKLHDIETNYISGVSLRIIKDGKLGFAYTRNLKDRKALVDNALRSLEGGVEAPYGFPKTTNTKKLDSHDESVRKLSGTDLLAETGRICETLLARSAAEIMAGTYTQRSSIRIMNSNGAVLDSESTEAGSFMEMFYPGSGSGFGAVHRDKRLNEMPMSRLEEVAGLYLKGQKAVEPKGGRMKLLFMPGSLITLLWRLSSGLSGRSIYERISPVAEKLGQKVFSDKLTVVDDPLDDRYPGARAFDDEGTACAPLTLVDRGVLKSFYYDLNYAWKLGAVPTGHGYRTGPWGGDPVSLKPGPALAHLFIRPGAASLEKLIGMIDRGIIVEGALGAHSGNIPNGDYSIGVSPGLYVENGQIVGRVKDAMVAGNIYQTLKEVVELGDTPQPTFGGAWAPPILCDGVSVATKDR